ncbi:MAG: hypothetical protein DHS80DRAFT_20878 [Piptocephalis tieghemiana]|nr:MAG: hypothetical protein DHS80DRAFT_20878 [Piptocephalis tieghemiana]
MSTELTTPSVDVSVLFSSSLFSSSSSSSPSSRLVLLAIPLRPRFPPLQSDPSSGNQRGFGTKWTEDETQAILTWWDNPDNFRSYVHGVKCRAQDKIAKLPIFNENKSPQQVRDKCQNLEKSYRKANRLVMQLRAGGVDPMERRILADRILKRCPYYQRLDKIFGDRRDHIPACLDQTLGPFLSPTSDPSGSEMTSSGAMTSSGLLGDISGEGLVTGSGEGLGLQEGSEVGMSDPSIFHPPSSSPPTTTTTTITSSSSDAAPNPSSARSNSNSHGCASDPSSGHYHPSSPSPSNHPSPARPPDRSEKKRKRHEAEVNALLDCSLRHGPSSTPCSSSSSSSSNSHHALPTNFHTSGNRLPSFFGASGGAPYPMMSNVEWAHRLRLAKMEWDARLKEIELQIAASERRQEAERKERFEQAKMEHESRMSALKLEHEMRLLEHSNREKELERRHQSLLREMDLRMAQLKQG